MTIPAIPLPPSKEGVLPDMVQIGNESMAVFSGQKEKAGEGGGEFDRLAGLLNAAIGGLRENLSSPSDVKIMLHLAEGTKNDTFHWWFDEITKRNVPFDIIGLSMYTYWDGPISALQTNMDDISQRYQKMSSSWKPLMAIPWKIVITPKIALPLKKRKMGLSRNGSRTSEFHS